MKIWKITTTKFKRTPGSQPEEIMSRKCPWYLAEFYLLPFKTNHHTPPTPLKTEARVCLILTTALRREQVLGHDWLK